MKSFLGFVGAEMRRLFSRRLFRGLAIGLIVAFLVSAGFVFFRSSKDPNAGLANARRDAAQCEADRAQQIQKGPIESGDFVCPSVDDLRSSYDKRFKYADAMTDATRGVAIALFSMSLLLGASFVGAEWGSGSMTTLLTWEPRRLRVLLAKVVAGVVVAAAAAVVALILLDLIFLPVAALRGTTAGLDAHMWRTLAGIWGRGAAVAAFGSAFAMALATITRNTAGSLGAGFVFTAILDPFLAQIRKGAWRPWLLARNLPQLIGFPVEVPQPVQDPGGGFSSSSMTLSATRPAILLACYALGLLAIAYAAFRARDVT